MATINSNNLGVFALDTEMTSPLAILDTTDMAGAFSSIGAIPDSDYRHKIS